MDLPRLHYNASISVAWKKEVVVSAGFAIVLFLGGSTSPLGASSFFSDVQRGHIANLVQWGKTTCLFFQLSA